MEQKKYSFYSTLIRFRELARNTTSTNAGVCSTVSEILAVLYEKIIVIGIGRDRLKLFQNLSRSLFCNLLALQYILLNDSRLFLGVFC